MSQRRYDRVFRTPARRIPSFWSQASTAMRARSRSPATASPKATAPHRRRRSANRRGAGGALTPRLPDAHSVPSTLKMERDMAIDFEIPEDAKQARERVRRWVQDEVIPAEARLKDKESYKQVLAELRAKARAQGLWCPFIPKEHGGMGLGPLANALVQMELGQSHLGALSMNSQGPRRRDDAHPSGARHGISEGEVPQAPAQRREAHLLFDDREGGRRRRHRHADPRREEGQQRLCAERREMVLVRGQRRRHRARHGQDQSRRAAPPAILDLHRRAAQSRLPHHPRHQDDGGGRPAVAHHGRRP